MKWPILKENTFKDIKKAQSRQYQGTKKKSEKLERKYTDAGNSLDFAQYWYYSGPLISAGFRNLLLSCGELERKVDQQ